MAVEIFKVLNHRESKNVYIFDIKLYTKIDDGHRKVLAEGKATVNKNTGKGQCSVFGESYTPSNEDISKVIAVCVQRARSLNSNVFDE